MRREILQVNHDDDKKKKWKSMMAEINGYGSQEGDDIPIDEGIKECVVAFNMLGIPTTASCAGHIEADRLGFPLVQGMLTDNSEANKASYARVQELIQEFNAGRDPQFALHFNPAVPPERGFRVESVAEQERNNLQREKGDEFIDIEKVKQLIHGAQAEFKDFTEFVKTKIF